MKRTALTLTLGLTLLFSAVAGTQLVNLGRANPMGMNSYEAPPSAPMIYILSPVKTIFYTSNNVWLNFTVTRPEDWLYVSSLSSNSTVYLSQGQIKFVQYNVWFGDHFPPVAANISEKIDVNDSLNGVNPPSNFNFSLNLKGLPDGYHRLQVYVGGYFYANRTETGRLQTIHFIVHTPQPEDKPFPTIYSMGFVTVIVLVLLGSIVYILKRK